MSVLIENKGCHTSAFYIPPFALHKGELIGLCLYSKYYDPDLIQEVASVFTGESENDQVAIYQPLTYVAHVEQWKVPWYRRKLFPVTVGEYIRKKGGKDRHLAEQVYRLNPYINPRRKVHEMAGTNRMLVSLFTALSRSDKLIFDVPALDPQGTIEVVRIVADQVRMGGAAILLDWNGWIKNHIGRYGLSFVEGIRFIDTEKTG